MGDTLLNLLFSFISFIFLALAQSGMVDEIFLSSGDPNIVCLFVCLFVFNDAPTLVGH